MLKFTCPYCQVEADETELTPGGEAHLKRMGPGSSDQEFYNYLFERKNLGAFILKDGCIHMAVVNGFHVVRCTKTMEVFGTYSAQETNPPKKILDIVKQRISFGKKIK